MDKITTNYLTCIYSSHADLTAAFELREFIKKENKIEGNKIIIVLSNEFQEQNFYYNEELGLLFLKVKECYTYLSLKTNMMILACLEFFEFEVLVKWDASTLFKSRSSTDKALDFYPKSMKVFNEGMPLIIGKTTSLKNYHSHMPNKVLPEDCAFWFRKKKKFTLPILEKENRELQPQKLGDQEIFYYLGKFYMLSFSFCSYIAQNCDEIFEKNFRYNCGAEDVAIGMCFEKFENDQ